MHKKKRRALAAFCAAFLLVAVSGSNLFACLWVYGTDPHGFPKVAGPPRDHLGAMLADERNDRAHWERSKTELQPRVDQGDKRARNDYAVALVHLGDYPGAIAMLEAIEKESPGDYPTAVNLGTAYELLGKLLEALQWITEGLRRDDQSHEGTEWLHVKILEARMHLVQDSKWLDSHSVLGMDFGKELALKTPPTLPKGPTGEALGLSEIKLAILYQLHERIPFVPPPDPVVADLLADLGNLTALQSTVEGALPYYERAIKYGLPKSSLAGRRLEHFKKLSARNPLASYSESTVLFAAIFIGGMAIVLVLRLVIRRLKMRKLA